MSVEDAPCANLEDSIMRGPELFLVLNIFHRGLYRPPSGPIASHGGQYQYF